MALKPWYKVVTPREDLREGRPLDASEFAVHLDAIREGKAPVDYQEPERFFERTYLTKNLSDIAIEVTSWGQVLHRRINLVEATLRSDRLNSDSYPP